LALGGGAASRRGSCDPMPSSLGRFLLVVLRAREARHSRKRSRSAAASSAGSTGNVTIGSGVVGSAIEDDDRSPPSALTFPPPRSAGDASQAASAPSRDVMTVTSAIRRGCFRKPGEATRNRPGNAKGTVFGARARSRPSSAGCASWGSSRWAAPPGPQSAPPAIIAVGAADGGASAKKRRRVETSPSPWPASAPHVRARRPSISRRGAPAVALSGVKPGRCRACRAWLDGKGRGRSRASLSATGIRNLHLVTGATARGGAALPAGAQSAPLMRQLAQVDGDRRHRRRRRHEPRRLARLLPAGARLARPRHGGPSGGRPRGRRSRFLKGRGAARREATLRRATGRAPAPSPASAGRNRRQPRRHRRGGRSLPRLLAARCREHPGHPPSPSLGCPAAGSGARAASLRRSRRSGPLLARRRALDEEPCAPSTPWPRRSWPRGVTTLDAADACDLGAEVAAAGRAGRPLPVDLRTSTRRQHPRYSVDWAARLVVGDRSTEVARFATCPSRGAAIEIFARPHGGRTVGQTVLRGRSQGQPSLEGRRAQTVVPGGTTRRQSRSSSRARSSAAPRVGGPAPSARRAWRPREEPPERTPAVVVEASSAA